MAKKGILKRVYTLNKEGAPLVTKKGQPYVRLLMLKDVDDQEGAWMSLFDAAFFGGDTEKEEACDVRSWHKMTPCVYEAEQQGDFVTCTRIRRDDQAAINEGGYSDQEEAPLVTPQRHPETVDVLPKGVRPSTMKLISAFAEWATEIDKAAKEA